jgi:hypothetical protein
MKKLLLTVTLCLACAAAFAQGKIRLVNDSVHLCYFTTDTSHLTDSSLAGQAYNLGMAAGQTLTIELWAGTSSTSLALAGSTAFAAGGTPGAFPGANITLSGIAGGATAWFQVDIYDSASGSYAAAAASMGHYYGQSSIFTAVTGATAYNSIASHSPSPGAASTWADGTYQVGGSLPGATGAIALLANIPEPSTIAMVGLAGAALMIFRRRK